MALSAGDLSRLQNLCRLFSVDIKSTEPNPPAALSILSLLLGMPAISNHDKRREYGNRILESTNEFFMDESQSSLFLARVRGEVILIQEIPTWYADFAQSSETLVRKYTDLWYVTAVLKAIGISGLSSSFWSPVAAGFKEATKQGTPKEALTAWIKTTLSRLAGKGPVAEGIEIVLKNWLPKIASGTAISGSSALFAFALALTTMYVLLDDEMQRIKIILTDRLRSGQLSDELYRKAFGNDPNPNVIKKYWEMN